ncbi:MAG: hypothetical protein IT271_06755 [Chitinophagales bacterium]|nr:hypothetical protein [Chitinophagales bacterium]
MSEHIVKQHPVIEALFASYSDVLGSDIERYKNHVYRIFNYSLYLSKNASEEKYAIAAFFHDIGIWTNHTFDYLQPSIALAKEYLIQSGKENWSEEITLMIDQHHKISSYSGTFESTTEIFRKADWADVSLGLIRFEIPATFTQQAKTQFPYKGFHFFLVKLFFKNLLRHPLKPLPMFKR